MDSISKDIGEKLKSIRKEMNMSLDTAAKLTGVSKAMLGQIERDVYKRQGLCRGNRTL